MTLVRTLPRSPLVDVIERPLGTGLPWESGGGGAPWTPGALGTKVTCLLDQRDQVVTGAGCSAWGDQSPGGTLDFIQGTDAARPPLSTVNGYSAPDFQGSDFMTRASAADAFTSSTASFVAIVTDTTGETPGADNANPWQEPGVFALGNTSGWIQIAWSLSGPRAYGFDGGVRVTARAAATGGAAGDVGLTLLVVKHDGVTFSLRRGTGTAVTAACTTLTTPGTGVVLGASYNAAALHNGRIAFVLTCNAALSAAEEAALRAYLAAKYGVQA